MFQLQIKKALINQVFTLYPFHRIQASGKNTDKIIWKEYNLYLEVTGEKVRGVGEN